MQTEYRIVISYILCHVIEISSQTQWHRDETETEESQYNLEVLFIPGQCYVQLCSRHNSSAIIIGASKDIQDI